MSKAPKVEQEIAVIDPHDPVVEEYISVVSDIFEQPEEETGCINAPAQ